MLWELVLTGEPIVVMAALPTVCSNTVQALVRYVHKCIAVTSEIDFSKWQLLGHIAHNYGCYIFRTLSLHTLRCGRWDSSVKLGFSTRSGQKMGLYKHLYLSLLVVQQVRCQSILHSTPYRIINLQLDVLGKNVVDLYAPGHTPKRA